MPNVNTYPPGTFIVKKNVVVTRQNVGNYFLSHPETNFLQSGQTTDDTGVNNEQFSYGWAGVWNANGLPQQSPVWADALQIENTCGWVRRFYPGRATIYNPTDGLHDSTKGAVNVLGQFLRVLDYYLTAGDGGTPIKVMWIINAYRHHSPLTEAGNMQSGVEGENEYIAYLDALLGSTQTSPLGHTFALHPSLGAIEVVNELTDLASNVNTQILVDPIGELHANYTRITERKLWQYRNNPSILSANPGLEAVKVILFAGSGGVSADYTHILSAHARSQQRTSLGLASISSNTINLTGHGRVAGDYVWLNLETIAGGTFQEWKDATYFVKPLTATTFQVASTFNGATITGGVNQNIEVYSTGAIFGSGMQRWVPFASTTQNSAAYDATTGTFTMTGAATNNYTLRTLNGGGVSSLASNIIQGRNATFNLRQNVTTTVDAVTFVTTRAFPHDVLTTYDGQFVGEIDRVIGAGPNAQLQLKANAAVLISSTLTGTIGVTQNTANLSGVGTSFTTELKVFDRVFKADGTFLGVVRSITNDTAAVLVSNWIFGTEAGITGVRHDCLQVRAKIGMRASLPNVMGANLWSTRPYYVSATGLTADAFRIQAHPGGAALTLNAIASGLRVSASTPVAIQGDDGVDKTALDYGIHSHHFYGSGGTSSNADNVVPGASSTTTGKRRHGTFILNRHQLHLGVAENILSMAGEYHLGPVTNVNTSTGVLTLQNDARLSNGTRILLQATTAPSGFTLGLPYFVVNTDKPNRTIQLSATPGGSAIVPTTSGTSVTIYQLHNWYGASADLVSPLWNTEYNHVENNASSNFGSGGNILRYYNSICNQLQKDSIFLATVIPGLFCTSDGQGGLGVAFSYGADLIGGVNVEGNISAWSSSPAGKLRITTTVQPAHSNGANAGFTVQNGTAETIVIDCRTGPGIPGVCAAGQYVVSKVSNRFGDLDIEIDLPYTGTTGTTLGNRWLLQRVSYGPDGDTWNKWMRRLIDGSPKCHYGYVHNGLQPLIHIEGKGIWYLDENGLIVQHI